MKKLCTFGFLNPLNISDEVYDRICKETSRTVLGIRAIASELACLYNNKYLRSFS